MRRLLFTLVVFLSFVTAVKAQKILIVTAHPDDDAMFACSVYKITHFLGGSADICLITNGEGGYKYSTLADYYYGEELTDEQTGRSRLPEIRKKELEAGGKIYGVKNFYYLNQKDHKYTNNIPEVIDSVWDTSYVKKTIRDLVQANNYDYIMCLIPTPSTHAHHSTAGILALTVVSELPIVQRPIVLGGYMTNKTDTTAFTYSGLEGYDVTKVSPGNPVFEFDRTAKFGFKDALDYKIISNWVIAEHKSQGTMQLLMNRGDFEKYVYFDINDKNKIEQTRELFEKLKVNYFKVKDYDLR